MFYRTMWGGFGARQPMGPDLMWSAYFNGFLSVDLENMPEDAEPDSHVGMRPSLSPAPSPAKGPLPSSEGPMANGAPEDRPPRKRRKIDEEGKPMNEEEKIHEYLQRSDTAVIFPEPVGGTIKKEDKGPPTPEPAPVIEEPKVPNEYLLKCPHCEQVFSGQQAINELKDHLVVAHKETSPPEANFVCQKCNASFTCKENLAKHKLFHTTNGQTSTVNADEDVVLRKFKCTECGKAFKFKHHLKEHIRIHSGEKPFACQNCGKRFSHSGSYSSHMTSKKCLVVNLKIRKADSRSPRGRGTQNNSFRPIIPKYATPGNNGATPRTPEMPLIPAGYMPSSERFSNFSGRPQQPYLPLAFHPLIGSPHYHLPMGAFPEVSYLLQQRRFENDCPPSAEQHSHSQLPPHMVSPSSSFLEKTEESATTSPKPQGELNAVKKILEIVDATVSKQQQSPTRPRNGLLSELLSSGPHPLVKTPPPVLGATTDSRCRFCCRLFDSKVDLYQHERYLCVYNSDLRTKSESSETMQENGSDGESTEVNRNQTSPSSLSVDCVLTLKAHYQINPRPKKSELIRLSRDLKCSTRTVQDWFHNQQIRSKDFSVNGEMPHTPPPTQSSSFSFHSPIPPNGHSFHSAVIPPYNGAISSNSQLVPFRPIPDRSPLLESTRNEDDQPLDLSLKMKTGELNTHANSSEPFSSPAQFESGALNLSQRSSRTPPKVSSPYALQNNRENHIQLHEDSIRDSSQNHIQSSLLYKYMQMGMSSLRQSPHREKSPVIAMPSSPDRSPSRAEQQPQSMPSPDRTSYPDHSSSPSVTTGSYGHTDDHTDGNPFSPNRKKMRLWNQGEGDESTLEDNPGAEEDSSGGSSKMRKSWKMHKIESEEGMYACDQCDKMFNKQSSLARHKYEHSGQRPHKCDVCSKAFKHKHHLTEHKRLHSGEKPFQCKKCLKRFSHSGSYSQHMNHRFSYCKPYHE